MLIVAWREITSGLSGVSFVTSRVFKSCLAKCEVSTVPVDRSASANVSSDILLCFVDNTMKGRPSWRLVRKRRKEEAKGGKAPELQIPAECPLHRKRFVWPSLPLLTVIPCRHAN